MQVIPERSGGALFLKIEGRIDGTNAHTFHEDIKKNVTPDDKTIVLDLEGLEYISSAGLRIILLVAKDSRNTDVNFAVCALNKLIGQVFQHSGFDQIINIHDTREAAIQSFS